MARNKTRATFTLNTESISILDILANFYNWKKTSIVEMALKEFYKSKKRLIDAYIEEE
jgi:hypothetical protein